MGASAAAQKTVGVHSDENASGGRLAAAAVSRLPPCSVCLFSMNAHLARRAQNLHGIRVWFVREIFYLQCDDIVARPLRLDFGEALLIDSPPPGPLPGASVDTAMRGTHGRQRSSMKIGRPPEIYLGLWSVPRCCGSPAARVRSTGCGILRFCGAFLSFPTDGNGDTGGPLCGSHRWASGRPQFSAQILSWRFLSPRDAPQRTPIPVGVFFVLAGVDFGGKVDYLREAKRELAALLEIKTLPPPRRFPPPAAVVTR
jgi:hypothetical protein